MSFFRRFFSRIREAAVGYAYPPSKVFSETTDISLADIMQLYEREPVCKASVDLLATAVSMGFYTTVNEEYEKAAEAKRVVDDFCKEVNLDGLLCDMAKTLIACGNDFWLKITPERLTELHRLPIDAVERVERRFLSENLKIPYKVVGYKLHRSYGGETLYPEAVIHWRINCHGNSAFGTGVLHVLLHTLTVNGDRRPAYAWMKAKIEKILPKIFEKYAGPDVLAWVPYASKEQIKQFENVIKNRPEEGAWIFYGEAKGKGEAPSVMPVQIDPRARFEYYVDYIVNQFYLGCQSPLPKLFTSPGFTEASARVALELQEMLMKPIQRYIKRQVERDIFDVVLAQAGFDPAKAQVRLNWGTPKVPEISMADMLKAAELGLIRPEEFRKNAVKFGWELWEPHAESETPVMEKRKVKSSWLLQKLE